jgi:hypothetical protein
MTAVVGTPTQITVTASISDPSLIPGGVNLLQLDADGAESILGTLHDDGLNGDAFAGDLVFTLLITLNSPLSTQIQLEVSAAFKDTFERVKSPVLSVFFQAANAPQQALAILAGDLSSGDVTDAMSYIMPSGKTTKALSTFNQAGLNALAAMLNSAVLVASQGNVKIFNSLFLIGSTAITVEFTMIPDSNG